MKRLMFYLGMMVLCASGLRAEDKGATKLAGPVRSVSGSSELVTYSSFDRPKPQAEGEVLQRGGLKLEDADLTVVLNFYQELSGRSVIRSSALPSVKISFRNETPLTRRETLQALDTVLAANGITMVLQGAKFVKAVASPQAATEAAPLIDLPVDQLPESSSYMMYIVKCGDRSATELVQILTPFSKLPNSIVALKEPGLLVLRDYSANIRRMLYMLDQVEKAGAARR